MLATARQHFKDGKWNLAKQTLLTMLNDDNQSEITIQTIFEKLGNVCLQLNELSESKMYYEKSIDCYINNSVDKCDKYKPTPYLRYAKLLHYELNDYKMAKTMYLKYINISIDKNNCEVYFHFAKLLTLMKQFEEAKRYYTKSLQSDASKACIHYHFGILLYHQFNKQTEGIYHLKQCIELKSNIAKYHFEYALMLKNTNTNIDYDVIDVSFENAVRLSNYHDTKILIEYSTFLIHNMNQRQRGIKFMNLALKLNEPDETKEILTFDDEKHATFNNKDNYKYLKCIMYEFDGCITYRNLHKSIHGDISHLYNIKEKAFIQLFGWRDRIRRLANHFEGILSKQITIIILFINYNHTYINVIKETLKKAYLHQYVSEIIKINPANEMNDKLNNIKYFKHKYNYKYNEILYIGSNENVTQLMNKNCCTIFISENRGLRMRHLENIENGIGIETRNYSSFQSTKPIDLMETNAKLYFQIKREIIRSDYNQSINNLQIIQQIHNNYNKYQYEYQFLEFATKFKAVCFESSKHNIWTAHEILQPLLQMYPHDSELNSRNATFCASMGDMYIAEQFYKIATRGRFITAIVNYGYFLMEQKRFQESVNMFMRVLKISPISIKSLIGIGRTFHKMGNYDDAYYYLRKAVAVSPNFAIAQYRLGGFLQEIGRNKEAYKYLNAAVQLNGNSEMNHFVLSLNLFELNNMEGFKYHLERSLDINPTFRPAKYKYYEIYGKYYIPCAADRNVKRFVLNGINFDRSKGNINYRRNSETEFDVFWYDKLEMWLTDNSFQTYYQYFKQHNMNNIISLFSVRKLKLREIGIVNDKHLEIIMKCINREIINEYDKFKEWLRNIIFDKRVLNKLCNTFLHHFIPIYSFGSFYRAISSKRALKSILSTDHQDLVNVIWESFQVFE
eukprot:554149_1